MSTQDQTQRYSDKDLEEFRAVIEAKLEKANSELSYYKDQMSQASNNGTDDTTSRFASFEDGALSAQREEAAQMISRQSQFINHLKKALERIENKTYGICRETGKLISKERLKAVPHATLSIDAKKAQER